MTQDDIQLPVKKRHTGLYIIASYFLIEALYGSYRYAKVLLSPNFHFNVAELPLHTAGFLVAATGLFFGKGWGWNFAIFFNFFFLIDALANLVQYFCLKGDILFLFKGMASIAIGTAVFVYLLRKKIRSIFPKSPVSLLALGIPLSMFGIMQDTGNLYVDYFWLAISIVGFTLVAKGGNELTRHLRAD